VSTEVVDKDDSGEIKTNTVTIPVENVTDVTLALLFSGGSEKPENEEVVGNTRLTKLMFLVQHETSLGRYLKELKYDAYNFGPYASELFDAVQALISNGLIKSTRSDSEGYLDEADRFQIEMQAEDSVDSPRTTVIYSLTAEGKTVGSALYHGLSNTEQEELTALKQRFNSISLRKLLQYVYRKYPNFTTESVIREYVF